MFQSLPNKFSFIQVYEASWIIKINFGVYIDLRQLRGRIEVILRLIWAWFEVVAQYAWLYFTQNIDWVDFEGIYGIIPKWSKCQKKPIEVILSKFPGIYMFSDYLIEGVQSRLWGGRRVKNGKTSPQNPLGRPVAPPSENWGLFGAFRGAFEAILRSSWGPNSIEVILRDCLFSIVLLTTFCLAPP